MTYAWYRAVTGDDPITQGDVIEDLPVLVFRGSVNAAQDLEGMQRALEEAAGVQQVRSVIMTQACDLKNDHVAYVQLCPVLSLQEFKAEWQVAQSARGQNLTSKAWDKAIEEIRSGRAWNYSMLNRPEVDHSTHDFLIVNFHEIYSLPVEFLRGWVRIRSGKRLQLLPPYREHLSQAFARYFMRVGLPIDIRLPK
jgi:hypothetical protein